MAEARVLGRIAERVLAEGGRLLVVSGEERQLHAIDEALWTDRPEGFLPHGRDDPEEQPVLLATELVPANGAGAVAMADGVWRDAALAFGRVFHLFGEAQIDDARAAWRGLAGRSDVVRSFWQREADGRWIRAA